MAHCSKCNRKTVVGFCTGCGEYGTYTKCQCTDKVNRDTQQIIIIA